MPQQVVSQTLNGNPCFRYVAQLPQLQFHSGREIYGQRAALCGTGAGKTLTGLMEDVIWALHYPGSVGYIFEPNYPMVRRNLFPALESKWLLGVEMEHVTQNPLVADFSRIDNKLTWFNGSQWWFVSLDDPEKAEGANIDYAHLDEGRLMRKFDIAWSTVIRRLRGSGRCRVDVKPSIWVTTTPDAPHTPLYNVTENPKTKSIEMKVFRWSIFENKMLPQSFIEEIVRTHTGGLGDRFIYGRFATVASGSLPFDSTKHERTITKDLIVKMRYGVDFGWSNPSALIAIAFDYDGRAYAVDEIYAKQMTSEIITSELKRLITTWGNGDIYCDPSEPETIDKLTRAGLRAYAYKGKREDGLREMGGRFIEASDGKPRLFIAPNCVNLISELLEYQETVKENDHAVDALRYGLPLLMVQGVSGKRGIVK